MQKSGIIISQEICNGDFKKIIMIMMKSAELQMDFLGCDNLFKIFENF